MMLPTKALSFHSKSIFYKSTYLLYIFLSTRYCNKKKNKSLPALEEFPVYTVSSG